MTDTLEIHIIELPKLIKRLSKEKGDKIEKEESYSMFILKPENIGDENMDERDKKLVLWMVFFGNPDALTEEELKENEDIRLAKEELERLKQDEHERYLAELREKHIKDIQSIQDYGIRKRTGERNRAGNEERNAAGDRTRTTARARTRITARKKEQSIKNCSEAKRAKNANRTNNGDYRII